MSEYPTLLQFDERPVPVLPEEYRGEEKPQTAYVNSAPREWSDSEVEWLRDMRAKGFTNAEIAESMGRTETSISIKLKRLGKANERYNEAHRKEKYGANRGFFEIIEPKSVLDLYCGTESWWQSNLPLDSVEVETNDIDQGIIATYHRPAEKLVAELYA